MGDFAREENISIVALAMMEQEGTGFIRMDEDGINEFERLTGFATGASDYHLNDLTERKCLVWPKNDIALLDWDKIREGIK